MGRGAVLFSDQVCTVSIGFLGFVEAAILLGNPLSARGGVGEPPSGVGIYFCWV